MAKFELTHNCRDCNCRANIFKKLSDPELDLMNENKKTFGLFLLEKLQINDRDWDKIGLSPNIERQRISFGEIGKEDFCVPKKITYEEMREFIKEYFHSINEIVTFKTHAQGIPDFFYKIGEFSGDGVVTPLLNRTLITMIPEWE